MEHVKVVKSGLFTTVQDLGRRDFQALGVSTSGAMDPFSLRVANILVGNDEGEAGLEVTLMDLKLSFCGEGVIAVTGGNLSLQINGQPVSMWKSLKVNDGDELELKHCRDGCRAYVSFAGGIEVPRVMGSRSTFTKGNYGGVGGRALKAGDRLIIGKPNLDFNRTAGRRLPKEYIPDYSTNRPVRFIWGPNDNAFTNESLKNFTTQPYSVSTQSDRMGYRLNGTKLNHVDGADILSDYITTGSIQVPAAGKPIILMADCQTTGGYTKIGVVIGVDIPYVAQKKPGNSITFQALSLLDAQELWRKQEKLISVLSRNNK